MERKVFCKNLSLRTMMEVFLRKGSSAVLGSVATIAVVIVEGVIGNRADGLFVQFIGWMIQSVNQTQLPWIGIGIFAVVFLVEGIYFWLQKKSLSLTLQRMSKLIDFDGSLLSTLATWEATINHQSQEQRIFTELLQNATVEFDRASTRAAILLPDQRHQFLQCWAHWNMPQFSIDDLQFYIGTDQRKKQIEGGAAGHSFETQKLIVGHLKQVNGYWVPDIDQHKNPHGYRQFPPYKSFVTVPITGIDPNTRNNTICFGILYFDSLDEKTFDTQETQLILKVLAERIASIILISRKFP